MIKPDEIREKSAIFQKQFFRDIRFSERTLHTVLGLNQETEDSRNKITDMIRECVIYDARTPLIRGDLIELGKSPYLEIAETAKAAYFILFDE